MADLEGEIKEKDAEIEDLKKQLEKTRGDRDVKTFSKDLKILDQCILAAAELEKQKADKLRDLEGKDELSEEEINEKMNQEMPIYELDSEMLQQLVLEIATFKNQKNREVEDLQAELAKRDGDSQETGTTEGDKKVSFTPDKAEEGDEEINQSAEIKVSPMEDSDYYLSDTSKIIRDEDLGNTDVVLSTLVKEIQDMKAKVTLIERSVLSSGAARTTSSSFYMSPSYGFRRVPEVTSYSEGGVRSPEACLPPKEDYKDAFLQKSIQLESLQRELAAIKGETLKFAAKRNNFQLSHSTPFPRRTYNPAPQTTLHKGRTLGTAAGNVGGVGMMSSRSSSALHQKGGILRSSRGMAGVNNTGGCHSSYLNWGDVSYEFEEERRDSLSSNASGDANEGEASDAALIRDVHRKYEKRFGRKSTRGELDDSAIAQPEETQYEGRVRDSDDFDWMKGVTNPPMGLSQEMHDRGNKYLRKVAKKYDKEHPNERSYPRYGMEEDHDLDMIERALRENFVETEHGLEYRMPPNDYY